MWTAGTRVLAVVVGLGGRAGDDMVAGGHASCMHGIERAYGRGTMHVLFFFLGGWAVCGKDIKSTGHAMGAVHGWRGCVTMPSALAMENDKMRHQAL